MGVNTYRIGINWARVEPQPGKFDTVELAFYDDPILSLKQAGVAPLITLNHFDYPGWVSDQGGWTNPKTVGDFVAYAADRQTLSQGCPVLDNLQRSFWKYRGAKGQPRSQRGQDRSGAR